MTNPIMYFKGSIKVKQERSIAMVTNVSDYCLAQIICERRKYENTEIITKCDMINMVNDTMKNINKKYQRNTKK